ncbi:hypothetical protein [Oryzifoliimicrobium ureilyticus]|uniref:hypothetical protein n=1 Tax=Oryzifoliimicrobium ureilyticus TaxID=3113724 RepID=UPI00307682C9
MMDDISFEDGALGAAISMPQGEPAQVAVKKVRSRASPKGSKASVVGTTAAAKFTSAKSTGAKRKTTGNMLAAREKVSIVADPAGEGHELQDTRVRLGEAFLEDLLTAWKSQGQAAISKVIDSRPQDFFKVVAATMPKDVTLNVSQIGELSDAELIDRIKALDAAIAPFLASAEDGEGSEPGERPEEA